MTKKEKVKCVIAMFIWNIAAWSLFMLMDAVAEFWLDEDGVLDSGLLTIPIVLTVLYAVLEKKLFGTVRFEKKYNRLLVVSFILITAVFGVIVGLLCLEWDIWLVPQQSRPGFMRLNGAEYVVFPFTYGLVSLVLGFVIKLTAYILYRRWNQT